MGRCAPPFFRFDPELGPTRKAAIVYDSTSISIRVHIALEHLGSKQGDNLFYQLDYKNNGIGLEISYYTIHIIGTLTTGRTEDFRNISTLFTVPKKDVQT